MSADLSDPNIAAKYQEIISYTSPTNWLLLSYGQSRDKLSLYASGSGGIEELQQQLHGDVFFVFLREERSFILISFVPEDISGVRRARALVHSRAVGSLLKAHHAAWTITKPQQLTGEAIRSKLKLNPDGVRSPSSPVPPPSPLEANRFHERRASPSPEPDALAKKLSNSIGSLQSSPDSPHRNRLQPDHTGSSVNSPIPPPKVDSRIPVLSDRKWSESQTSARKPVHNDSQANPSKSPKLFQQQVPLRTTSKTGSVNNDPVPMTPNTPARSPPQISKQPTLLMPPQEAVPPVRTAAQEQAAQSRAKWASEAEAERHALARQRSRIEMQREMEAQQQAMYDAERSARLKRERDEKMQMEMDEDDRRRAEEQEKAQKLAAQRAAEDQRRRDEMNKKKEMEAQRRRTEVAARIQREKEALLQQEKKALESKRKEEERLAAQREIQKQFSELRVVGAVMLTGNVTMQASDSMYWRRRYFELSQEGIDLFKSSDTLGHRLDHIDLDSHVRAITEHHDELQSISHSFAIEFKDGSAHLFFCDTKEDKEVLVSAIMQVVGL